MEIKWAIEAKNDYHDTLDYWEEHNGSFAYSAFTPHQPLLYIFPTAFGHRNTFACGQFQYTLLVVLTDIAVIDQIGLMRTYKLGTGQ